jgi:hypothetical protein
VRGAANEVVTALAFPPIIEARIEIEHLGILGFLWSEFGYVEYYEATGAADGVAVLRSI